MRPLIRVTKRARELRYPIFMQNPIPIGKPQAYLIMQTCAHDPAHFALNP